MESVIATPLTLALVKSKLDEHGLAQKSELVAASPGDEPLELGPFRVELVRVAHSIPDSAALVIETPAGRVVHTGDWKLDHTPVDGLKTDVGKLAEIGNRGVDLLLGDSTNAERPGNTGSERLVGEAFRSIFPLRRGKILVASFASNIHRMQQAADVAVECGRKVVVVGRSMRKNLNIARNLGYVSFPEDAIVNPDEAAQLPPERAARAVHGEPGRADVGAHAHRVRRPQGRLGRAGRHRRSSPRSPCPGNELRVHDSINQLARAGAEVLHEEIAPVHVSGPRVPGGAADDALAPAAAPRDADPRRVPDAGRAREARARGGRSRGADPHRRERIGRRARARRRAARRTGSTPASRSSTASASATSRTSRCATGAGSPTTACSSS